MRNVGILLGYLDSVLCILAYGSFTACGFAFTSDLYLLEVILDYNIN